MLFDPIPKIENAVNADSFWFIDIEDRDVFSVWMTEDTKITLSDLGLQFQTNNGLYQRQVWCADWFSTKKDIQSHSIFLLYV